MIKKRKLAKECKRAKTTTEITCKTCSYILAPSVLVESKHSVLCYGLS